MRVLAWLAAAIIALVLLGRVLPHDADDHAIQLTTNARGLRVALNSATPLRGCEAVVNDSWTAPLGALAQGQAVERSWPAFLASDGRRFDRRSHGLRAVRITCREPIVVQTFTPRD